MDAAELVSQLRRRHEKSTQASSATLVATIDAINETLQSNNMSKTFVSYLGACMSAMTRVSSSEESVTLTALCALLAAVIPNVPKQYTRSKFTMMVSTLCTAIGLLDEADAGTGVKWAVQALSHVLAAPDLEGTWASASTGFIFLVKMTMDGHPKSRRAAHEGLAMVMEAYPGTAAHQPASQELADIAKVVLAAPKLAAKAASEATKSTREAAEEVIVAAVQDCLHLLGALKLVLPCLTEAAKLQICDHVLAMLILNQPLLTMHGTECLIRAVQGSSSGSEAQPAAKVQQLLSAALQQLDSQKSPDNIASVLRLLEEGLQSLRRRSTGACAQALPSAVTHIAPLLAAESDSVRHTAATTLVALLGSCVSEEMVAADALDTARAGGRPGGLQRVMAALTGMLGASYRDAWPGVMRVLAAAFEALGEPGSHLVEPALVRLADMCRGSADAEEYASLAHATVGASIAAQGPRAVLAVAALDVSDLAACDTWVIPLLRKHASGTQMAFWGEFMLPRARLIGSMSARARHLGHASDHVKLAALELQMWNTLASFARWAVDVPTAFTAFGETLGAAFQRRPDLQAPICNVLRRVCGDTCAALRAFGVADGAGYGDAAEDGTAAGGDAATSVFALRVGPGQEEVPGTFTEEMALGNREAVRGVAQKWLTELLNRYVKLPPESRGGVGETVAAVAAVAGEALAGPFFKEALSKVIASLQSIQGGEEVVLGDPEADVCTFLEVAVLLAPGLRDTAMAPLFKAARLVLALKKPAPQKKAYKALAYLFTQRSAMLDAHAADAVAVLLDSAGVDAAAKRHRLRCILPVILLLARAERGGGPEGAGVKDSPAQSARLVTELVLGIKEVNTKTRMEAYGVLVRTAHALHEAQPPQRSLTEPASASSLTNGGLQRFFSSILAGVASHTPRMVSAAVMALARLTFEFAPELQVIAAELLPPVCTLLQSKAREVIKAALGFLKVVALRVPADLVTPHLPLIVEGVLVWAEDSKNKFKLKVRRLIERLCKRCGYEAVAAAWPEAHQKLLTAVRKGMARSARHKSRGADGEGSEGGASAASGARTARASEWGHSGIFSDDDVGGGEDGDARSRAGMSTKSKQSKGSRAPTSKVGGKANGKTQSRLADDEGNPVDLLDGSTARALVRSAARGEADDEAAVEFERNPLGKLVFREEEEDDVMASPRRRKRKRGGDVDSDDSDLEDLKGIAGLSGAMKATRNAESLKGAAKYAHSHKSGVSRKSRASAASGGARGDRAALHTGAKFKSKKAAGDSQRGSKVEPYAYWRLDKNLLNSRKAKSRGAKSTLGGVIKTDAPAKGRKAKKRRAAE